MPEPTKIPLGSSGEPLEYMGAIEFNAAPTLPEESLTGIIVRGQRDRLSIDRGLYLVPGESYELRVGFLQPTDVLNYLWVQEDGADLPAAAGTYTSSGALWPIYEQPIWQFKAMPNQEQLGFVVSSSFAGPLIYTISRMA